MSEHHGLSGFDQIALASTQPGNNLGDTNFFGRLLPPGPKKERDEVAEALAKLANSMNEGPNPDPSADNPNLPLGFVFLGQFIDHDVTLDVTSSLKRASDIARIPNVRTPGLDLDSVYADGPEASSFLYRRATLGPEFKDRFLIGNAQNDLDFARTIDGIALIGDPRNDENGIISQLHILFLRFHNAVLEAVENDEYDEVYDEPVTGKDVAFEQSRRAIRRHYQWIIVNEFLPAIVDPGVLDQAIKDVIDSDAYKNDPIWGNAPSMPLEFAGAAYRFGHSMVRNTYILNAQRQGLELFKNPGQTDKEGMPAFNFVPKENVLDWRYFFDVDSSVTSQKVRQINTQMANEFFNLPFVPASDAAKGEASLAFRNLLRGEVTLSLPSGEEIAKAFGVTPIPLHPKVQAAGLTETPLWFYCLAEGEHFNSKLGPVGGRIVAMTLLRLLKEDPESYVCRQGWKPFLGETPGQFTMADMVKFVENHEGISHPGSTDHAPVVNFGEHFCLKSEDGKAIVATEKYSDGRFYPRFGASSPIKLFFQGGNGKLTNNAKVQLITTESSVGNKTMLGAWKSRHACYFWTDHNSQMQWWTVTKVDGSDGEIRYGDKVYITNCHWNKPFGPKSNNYLYGKKVQPQFVWIIDKA